MKKNLGYGLGVSVLFLLFSYSQIIYAIDKTSETDVQSLALGDVRSLSPALSNPAAILLLKNGEIGIFTINRFGMKELNTSGVYGIFPNKWLSAGCKFSSYGYEEYRLSRGEISLAKKITPEISIGVQFGCLHENSILKEQNKTYFIADPGIYWRLHPKFELAFITENLFHTSKFVKPSFYTGIIYKPIPEFHVFIENGFNFQNQVHLSFGIQYEILYQLTFRCGFRTDSSNPAIGASWKWERWKIDAVFLLHNFLDLSSGLNFSYSF
jgi:hypothetical protein